MSARFTGSPAFDLLARNSGPATTLALGNNTLAAWVKFADVVTYSEVLFIADSLNSFQYASGIILDPGFGIGALQRSTAGFEIGIFVAPPSSGVWTHVALTYAAGGTCTFYVNGVSVGTNSSALGSRGNWGVLQVGAGNLDLQDAVYYNAVLTQAEIQQLMAARLPVRRSNLIVHLPLFPGSNRNIDYSGNGNTFVDSNGTPVDGDPVPRGWGTSAPQVIIPLATAVSAQGDGRTVFDATGTQTAAAPRTGAGQAVLNGTGAQTAAAAKVGAGQVLLNGSAAQTAAAGKVGDGRAAFSGLGAATAASPAAADGRVLFNGAAQAAVAVPRSGDGRVAFNASATASVAAAAVADGRVVFNGAGSIGLVATGRTDLNAFATASVTAAAIADGRTSFDGSASRGSVGAGATAFDGSGTPAVSFAAAAAGLTRFNGTGVSAAPSGGGGIAYPSSRRGALVYHTRRRIR